jgi:hypothetical protein
LACPTRGIEFDPATLDLIDKDHDGRIRAPELIEACQWAVAQVRHPDVLTSGSDVLQLSNLDTEGASGAALHAEALRILRLLGLGPLLTDRGLCLAAPAASRWKWTGRRGTTSRGAGTWRATPGGVPSTPASLLFATARRGGSCWRCGGTSCSTQSAPLWW